MVVKRHQQRRRHSESVPLPRPTMTQHPQSIDSYRAEKAALQLEQELRQKGYDPKTGGSLMMQETISQDSDCDKYWQTPEQDRPHDSYSEEEDYTYTVDDATTSYCTDTVENSTIYTDQDWARDETNASRSHGDTRDDWSVPVEKRRVKQQELYWDDSAALSSEDSFTIVSKLQDPRARLGLYNGKAPLRQQHRRNDMEDPSVIQLHKRRIHSPINPRQPPPPPQHQQQQRSRNTAAPAPKLRKANSHLTRDSQGRKLITGTFVQQHSTREDSGHSRATSLTMKSPASAATRQIMNTAAAAAVATAAVAAKTSNNGRGSPSYHHDMAGRIHPPRNDKFFQDQNRDLSSSVDDEDDQSPYEAFELQEMSSASYDRKMEIPMNRLNDGAPPSNVAVFGTTKNDVSKSTSWKQTHIDSSKLMGKELLFVEEDKNKKSNTVNKRSRKTPKATKVMVPQSSTLTKTPPKPLPVAATQRQPAFLATKVPAPVAKAFDAQVVTISGDVELQLPRPHGIVSASTFTNAQAPTRGLPHKKSSFLGKFLCKDPALETAAMDKDIRHNCGLVSRKELVQEGWSPSDLPDEVLPQSDMSLFGRLIALSQNAKSNPHQDDETNAPMNGESQEEVQAVSPKSTQEWEVLSRESECLSEEDARLLDQENCFLMPRILSHPLESDGGSSHGGFSIASAPVVYSLPKLEAEKQFKKKKRNLFKQIFPSKSRGSGGKQTIENLSSIHSSCGSSIPSNSHASNLNSKGNIKTDDTASSAGEKSKPPSTMEVLPNLYEEKKSAEVPIIDKYSGQSQEKMFVSTFRKCDPPVSPVDAPSQASFKTATTGSGIAISQTSIKAAATVTSTTSGSQANQGCTNGQTVALTTSGSETPSLVEVQTSSAKPLSSSKSHSSDNLGQYEREFMVQSCKDTSKKTKARNSPNFIEAMLAAKGPQVSKHIEQEESAALQAFILSTDSDDGIPVPSVSVQQLRAMLQSQHTLGIKTHNPQELSQDKPTKRQLFGMARLLQHSSSQNHDTALGDALSETAVSEDLAEKENGMIAAEEVAEQKGKVNGTKSLLDALSVQSSLGTSSMEANQNFEATTLTFNPTDSEQGSQNAGDQVQGMPACGSINGLLNGEQTPRKNVRFSEFVETLTLSASSTYDESSKRFESHNKKVTAGTRKKLLRWIGKKHSKKSTKQSPVAEEVKKEEREESSSDSTITKEGEEDPYAIENASLPCAAHSDYVSHLNQDPLENSNGDRCLLQSSPVDRPDGIELVARRSKNGKNAILIASSASNASSWPSTDLVRDSATKNSSTLRDSKQNLDYSGPLDLSGRPVGRLSNQKNGFFSALFRRSNGRKRSGSESPRRKKKPGQSSLHHRKKPQQSRVRCASPSSSKGMKDQRVTRQLAYPVNEAINLTGGSNNDHQQTATTIESSAKQVCESRHASQGQVSPLFSAPPSSPSPLPTVPPAMTRELAQPDMIFPVADEVNRHTHLSVSRFARESSLTSKASSGISLQYTNSSNKETHVTETDGTDTKDTSPSKSKVLKQASTATSRGDDWFSWLWGPITQPVSAADPQIRNPDFARASSAGTKKSTNSHLTAGSRSTIGTPYHGDDYSHDYTQSTASIDDQAVKSKKSRKKVSNAAASHAMIQQEDKDKEVEQIPEHQWQEILDATETLAMSFKQKQHPKKSGTGHTIPNNSGNASVSEDSIDEVKRAIQKFREHARLLGVQERDLMEAVRDDDRSVPSKNKQRGQQQQPQQATNGGGGVTDKFLEMFDYFFVGLQQQRK